MGDHLWPLLRLTADSEIALQAAYRKVYLITYVRDAEGQEVDIRDWRGTRIRFSPGNFDHAFSESSDFRFGPGNHDILFSKKRARHILWIKEVLHGTKGTIELLQQNRKGSRSRQEIRRVFFVREERYAVVLRKGKLEDEWNFVTAFTATQSWLEGKRRDHAVLETKKCPSLKGD